MKSDLDSSKDFTEEESSNEPTRLHRFASKFRDSPKGRIWQARFDRFRQIDIGKSAAASTFYFLFSLFPLIILLVNVLNLINPELPTQLQQGFAELSSFIPIQILTMLVDFFQGAQANQGGLSLLSVAAFGLLWAGAKGVGSIVTSLNSIYRSRFNSNFLIRRILGLLSILIITILLLAILLFLSFSRVLVEFLDDFVQLPDFLMNDRFNITSNLIAFFVLTFIIFVIYQVMSKGRSRVGYTLICAALAAVGWMVISNVLSLFFVRREAYYSMYGSITNVIFLLLWLFLANYILMAGAYLHTELMRKYGLRTKVDSNPSKEADDPEE